MRYFNQLTFIIFCLFCLLSITNCASITKGSTQIITIETPNCIGASCKITNNEGTYYVSRTPATIVVNRDNSPLQINCSYGDKEILISDESSVEGMAFGNILVGGIIGGGIDMITGAAYEYPQIISHPLICDEEKNKESDIENLQRQIDELKNSQ